MKICNQFIVSGFALNFLFNFVNRVPAVPTTKGLIGKIMVVHPSLYRFFPLGCVWNKALKQELLNA